MVPILLSNGGTKCAQMSNIMVKVGSFFSKKKTGAKVMNQQGVTVIQFGYILCIFLMFKADPFSLEAKPFDNQEIATKGVFDLSKANPDFSKPIPLDGEWNVYLERFIDPNSETDKNQPDGNIYSPGSIPRSDAGRP